MSAREFRNQPIDRRRLTEPSRSEYSPRKRETALSRVKQFRQSNNYEANRKPFATEQKPGSGGFKLGSYAQGDRQSSKKYEEDRAESFRPESGNDSSPYEPLTGDKGGTPKPPVNAETLAREAKNKYI